jgi:ADP-ribose pyrophosphatase
MKSFEVLEVTRKFTGFFSVDEALVQFEKGDGTMSHPMKRLSVERGDAVGLIVFDRDKDRLVFARQFRYPTIAHGFPWLLECAAGMIDKGETAEEAARRELKEELGYQAKTLIHLGDFFASPGGMSEQLSMFFAELGQDDLVSQGGGLTDENEDIERVELSRQEVADLLTNNGFRDGKTLVGLLQAKLRGLI